MKLFCNSSLKHAKFGKTPHRTCFGKPIQLSFYQRHATSSQCRIKSVISAETLLNCYVSPEKANWEHKLLQRDIVTGRNESTIFKDHKVQMYGPADRHCCNRVIKFTKGELHFN